MEMENRRGENRSGKCIYRGTPPLYRVSKHANNIFNITDIP